MERLENLRLLGNLCIIDDFLTIFPIFGSFKGNI